ncbi:MAG TPA: VCBS repeat-containing protein, partial [Candidatus Polarisedimenticolia bacterium]
MKPPFRRSLPMMTSSRTFLAVALVSIAALSGCGGPSSRGPGRATVPRPPSGPWLVPEVAPGSGTRAMVERLDTLARTIPPEDNFFDNNGRAERLKARLAGGVNSNTYLDLQPQLALELLNAGRPAEAIEEFTNLQKYVADHHVNISRQHRSFLRWNLAVAELRLGETENCLTQHTTQSCLLPIRGAGIHTIQRGSRAALALLTEQLKEFPDDLQARWLYNIAAMTVGDYPEKVPAAWLIPPKIFESEGEAPHFTDIAGRLGLDVDDNAGGVIVDDFDNDGDLDVVASSSSMHGQLRFFRNNGDGTFTERTKEAGLLGEVGGLNLVQADYNNDGFLDLFVLRGAWLRKGGHHPNSLLRNNGDGTFDDVTEAAGVLSYHPTQTAVWFDYNGDGWIDLYIGNETKEDDPQPSELYRNNGDGTFTEIAAETGLAIVGMIKAVVSADYNNDGRPDLYVTDLWGTNRLFRNDGPRPGRSGPTAPWVFTEVGAAAGVTEPAHSFPAWFFDYDNDGWPDL